MMAPWMVVEASYYCNINESFSPFFFFFFFFGHGALYYLGNVNGMSCLKAYLYTSNTSQTYSMEGYLNINIILNKFHFPLFCQIIEALSYKLKRERPLRANSSGKEFRDKFPKAIKFR